MRKAVHLQSSSPLRGVQASPHTGAASGRRIPAVIWLAALAASLTLQACGGGEDVTASEVPEVPAEALPDLDADADAEGEVDADVEAAAADDNCLKVPAAPPRGSTRSVAEFGARPDDTGDDTAALQRALDGLQAGQTLVFPPGRYLINGRLRARVAGTTLSGAGATLHATNPADQALIVQADNIAVRSFTFTAVTDVRRGAPYHSRIAVWFENADGSLRTIRNTVIQGNRITYAGAPGTRLANSGSAGGIMLLNAHGFLVAGNTVERTLADGIHITGGSRNGRVLDNTVRETGDDMIAVVSYANTGAAALSSAAALKQNWASRVDQRLSRNILVAGNTVSGQYWGRGITVVGGRAISLRRNRIDNVPNGSAILLAREANYETFGVSDVLVDGNTITNVQNLTPPYDMGGKFASNPRSGHGAVEMHASHFDDEAADAQLRTELSVRNIKLVNNIIRTTAVAAIRAGVGFSGSEQAINPATGAVVSRNVRTALLSAVSVQTNRFDGVPGEALNVVRAGVASDGLHCQGNTRDGRPYTHAVCTRAAPNVQGAVLRCSASGQVQ